MTSAELCWGTASELARAIRTRQISAVEVVRAVLDRIEQVDPWLNAYVTVIADQALAEAGRSEARQMAGHSAGPLDGVPVSIKDIVFTRGVRTTGGSRLHETFVPTEDAPVVERLRRAGAIVIGKTNTSEFGHKPVTDNPLFGQTRNPWDLGRTPGGSSGGSAAAVAAGLGPISIGNDGGGSVRVPAALCGIVGFKPTAGRIPQYPGFPGWDLLGHTGPLTRSVADVALVMQAVAGPDRRDVDSLRARPWGESDAAGMTGLRVGWTANLTGLEPPADAHIALARAADVLAKAGCHVEELAPGWPDPADCFRVLVATELAAALGEHLPGQAGLLDPPLVKFLAVGQGYAGVEYVRALAARRAFARQVAATFERIDLLLTLSSPVPAFPLGPMGPREIAGRRVSPAAWLGWTYPFNLTGQPAISLPAGLSSEGLPLGVQLVGRVDEDGVVLAAALAYEALAYPSGLLRPPLG